MSTGAYYCTWLLVRMCFALCFFLGGGLNPEPCTCLGSILTSSHIPCPGFLTVSFYGVYGGWASPAQWSWWYRCLPPCPVETSLLLLLFYCVCAWWVGTYAMTHVWRSGQPCGVRSFLPSFCGFQGSNSSCQALRGKCIYPLRHLICSKPVFLAAI